MRKLQRKYSSVLLEGKDGVERRRSERPRFYIISEVFQSVLDF
jgi:hypothetical protein